MDIKESVVDGVRYLAPRESGRADLPTVLFVHGSGGNADVWRPILNLFTKLRPIAVDMPGHGGSSGPCLTTVGEGVAFVDRLRERLGLDRVVVFGHSLGGAIAQLYAHEHRERCLGIIVASSGTRFTADPARTARVRAEWENCIDEFARGQVSPRASAEARAAAHAMVAARDPEVFATDLTTCRGWDSRPWLSTITTPCLVLVGMEDSMTPLQKSLEIYELVPHAQLEVVSPGGHSPFLEHPLRYASAIESFVAELAADIPMPYATAAAS